MKIAFLIVLGLSVAHWQEIKGAVPTGEPVFVGQRDAKKFYSTNELSTWQEALNYCHINGLDSVAFATQHEMAYVGEQVRGMGFRFNYFWTSGHDFFTEGVYKWMKTNTKIDHRIPNVFGNSTNPRASNCVQMSLKSNGFSLVFDYDCNDRASQPLCEGPLSYNGTITE